MTTPTNAALMDFEAYILMTMKLRITMADKGAQLEAKLAEQGLSVHEAELIYGQIAEALRDEASRFENLKKLLGITDPASGSLKYGSVFWPGFEFNATADGAKLLESAGYRHTGHNPTRVDSPADVPTWSVDVAEFTEQFGPMELRGKWPLFDEYLPAYEEYEFSWNGEDYGARFMWGLFLSSSIRWD